MSSNDEYNKYQNNTEKQGVPFSERCQHAKFISKGDITVTEEHIETVKTKGLWWITWVSPFEEDYVKQRADDGLSTAGALFLAPLPTRSLTKP